MMVLEPKNGSLIQPLTETNALAPTGYLTTNEQRAYGGSNLIYQAPLLKMLNEHSNKEGQKAARNYIQRYFEISATATGALPGSGNHLYYSPVTKQFISTEQDNGEGGIREKFHHEWGASYMDGFELWPIIHSISPALSLKYAEAIWDKHVFQDGDLKGHWDRHDQPSRDITKGSFAAAYIGAASSFSRAFLFQASVATNEKDKKTWRNRFYSIHKKLWANKNPTTNLIPLITRRDMGLLRPSDIGWKSWPVADELNKKIPVFMDSSICTDKGYSVYNLPMILRDPSRPNDANSLNPLLKGSVGRIVVENAWKLCTQTGEAPSFWAPLLVEASKVFNDSNLLKAANMIMSAYHKRSNVNGKLQVFHHISCNVAATKDPTSPSLAKLLLLYGRWVAASPAKKTELREQIIKHYGLKKTLASYSTPAEKNKAWGAITSIYENFNGKGADCTNMSLVDADWQQADRLPSGVQASPSYPSSIGSDDVWAPGLEGSESALLPSRGYLALAKNSTCSYCVEGVNRIIDKMEVSMPRFKMKNSQGASYYSSDYGMFAWQYAESIRLSLDMYELTMQKMYLKDAQVYADQAISKLYQPMGDSGFFRSHQLLGYESVSGADTLALEILRLSKAH